MCLDHFGHRLRNTVFDSSCSLQAVGDAGSRKPLRKLWRRILKTALKDSSTLGMKWSVRQLGASSLRLAVGDASTPSGNSNGSRHGGAQRQSLGAAILMSVMSDAARARVVHSDPEILNETPVFVGHQGSSSVTL